MLSMCVVAKAQTLPQDASRSAPHESSTGRSHSEAEQALLDELSLVKVLNVPAEVVTATRAVPVEPDLAPSVITVITREQVRRYGYRTVPEALSSVPGLFLINDLTTFNVAIRGIHAGPDSWSRTIKFLIDGKPVQYNATGGALLGPEFVPIYAVERIEVVRGPASALYGANAFLGVVNVITARPEHKTLEGAVEGEGALLRDRPGGGGGAHLSVHSGGRRPLWARLSVYAERLDRSGLAVPKQSPRAAEFAGRRSRGDTSSPISALARAGVKLGRAGDLELESVFQRLRAHAQFGPVSALDSRSLDAKLNSVTRLDHRVRLLDDWSVGPDYRQQLVLHTWVGVAHARTLDAELFSTATGLAHRKRLVNTTEAGTELSYTLGRHSALLGVDYQHIQDRGEVVYDLTAENSASSARNKGVPRAFDNVGVFVQVIASPWQPLALTAGLRYDHGNLVKDAVTYRCSAVLRIIEQLSVKLAFGTSFVPPGIYQLASIPLSLPGGVAGNADLENQRARTAEASLLVRPLRALRLDMTGYWTHISDRVEYVSRGNLFIADNLTDSNTFGVEADASWDARVVRLIGTASYQTTSVDRPSVQAARFNVAYGTRPQPSDFPHWLAQLRANVPIPAAFLELSVVCAYVGKRKATVENILRLGEIYYLPRTFVLGAHVTTHDLRFWDGRETRISLHAEDLLGSGYTGGGILGVDVPPVGRSFFLRVLQQL